MASTSTNFGMATFCSTPTNGDSGVNIGTSSATFVEDFDTLFRNAGTEFLNKYYRPDVGRSREAGKIMSNFLVTIANDGFKYGKRSTSSRSSMAIDGAKKLLHEFVDMEKRVQMAYRIHGERFPAEIWHCCNQFCFASLAIDPGKVEVMDQILLIYDYTEQLHRLSEKLGCYAEERRRGIGITTVAYVSEGRRSRELESRVDSEVTLPTNRRRHAEFFAKWVSSVLPILYAKKGFPSGTPMLSRKLCTQAICQLLSVSRNYLYYRPNRRSSGGPSETDLLSIVDTTGLRLRQMRRLGQRDKYTELEDLPNFQCGCDYPCFADVDPLVLGTEYAEFAKIARELKPRHKENKFLIDRLFCPITNTTIKTCDRSLAELYTVSTSLIGEIRGAVNGMCKNVSPENRELLEDGTFRYEYDRRHPINRYSNAVRAKLESTLDMVLRADPAGSENKAVCRVYSPEISTQEKLRKVLKTAFDADVEFDVDLSASSVQRMISDYLRRRNYSKIVFTQSDHNACPQCKTLRYAILQFHYERKVLSSELSMLSSKPMPYNESDFYYVPQRIQELQEAVDVKEAQEMESLREMRHHNERDGRIRGFVKRLSDLFRSFHNRYAVSDPMQYFSPPWNSLPGLASITHQDDMTKVDLPYFAVSASSEITRWRWDVNAHVNAVTNDAVVFSHEQGGGAKTASTIFEEIVLNRVLTCRGESIAIVVSDNAAVGKNWITTIALPQFMVDKGLVKVAMVMFLENNHGKWLADMLFGQFQSRKRRSVIIGIDDMLSAFEEVSRKGSAKVLGFALNPSSCVDFSKVLKSLGYETAPPKDFGFNKRDIHFATACGKGYKSQLQGELRDLLSEALPDDEGMVRISAEPPGLKAQRELPYESRYFDVPAVRLTGISRPMSENSSNRRCQGGSNTLRGEESANGPGSSSRLGQVLPSEPQAPLIVPLDTPYRASGTGVVSHRTATVVGYNGIEFRKTQSCPEMRQDSSSLVRRAWPAGMLANHGNGCPPPNAVGYSALQGNPAEVYKCAPLNWVVRRPVSHFCESELDWKARYPPRNMLNALYFQPPYHETPWVPTATYPEPPFPILNGTSAARAMKNLSVKHRDIGKLVNVLDVLPAVFEDMNDRQDCENPWLLRRCTVPSAMTVERYSADQKLHVEREQGHPRAPMSAKAFFRMDGAVLQETKEIVERHAPRSVRERNLMTTRTINELYEKAEKTPGALHRFHVLAEKDLERFAAELKEFRKRQWEFDNREGLLPVEGESPS